ncbi:MAG: transporter substrate-binding domain-containing protein [Pelosinus sp.]|nr:transporter substrate-binding domain-containing protein [Pelosinus sp.]
MTYVFKIFVTVLLLLCCHSLFLPTAANAAIDTITVTTDDNYPPYSFRNSDGQLQGILIDQWQLWEQKTGIKVKLIGTSLNNAFNLVDTRQADVIDKIFTNDDRLKKYDFSEPYDTIPVCIFFSKNISGITNLESLKGFPVAVTKSDAAIALLKSNDIANIIEYDSSEEIIGAAKDQKISVFIMDKPPALYYLYKYGIQDKFNVSESVNDGHFHRAVKKGNLNTLLLIDAGFKEISANEYKAITKHWLGTVHPASDALKYGPTAVSLITILAVLLLFWNYTLKRSVRKKASELYALLESLKASNTKYEQLLSNLNVAVLVYTAAGQVSLFNQSCLKLTELTRRQLLASSKMDGWSCLRETGERLPEAEMPFHIVAASKKPLADYIIGIHRLKSNTTAWVQVNAFPEFDSTGNLAQIVVTLNEVTALKKAVSLQNALLRLSEKSMRVNNSQALYQAIHEIIGELISAEHFYIGLYNEQDNSICFVYSTDPFHKSDSTSHLANDLNSYVIKKGQPLFVNSTDLTYLQENNHFLDTNAPIKFWHGVPLKKSGNDIFGVLAVLSYTADIYYKPDEYELLNYLSNQISSAIQRKYAEEKLHYLTFHDSLTNLYNRTFFEQQFKSLENAALGIVVLDVDGLKLVNDTFGHEQGDALLIRAADVLRLCFADKLHIISRIGGDEFVVLWPDAAEEKLHAVYQQLNQLLAEKNKAQDTEVPLHISMGYALSSVDNLPTNELFRLADNRMYRDKLHRKKSVRSNILRTLKQMLAERDFITSGHANRMQDLIKSLAIACAKKDADLADLELFAEFHDIGKVGIPDRILNKPDKLTADEHKEMQTHSEIGYRIAKSSQELSPIADWILKHHEAWDGSGYPLGLLGTDIPLACRMLAIIDTYDAITNDRPYRKAASRKTALAEIERCAGTQFDPELVKKFSELIK